MNAFLCVYLHLIPKPGPKHCTVKAAESNQTLRRFLDVYDNPDCYYDWGDDPSFFAANEFFGDVRHATWGVCRTDVRRGLKEAGDYVVFFCAKQVDEDGHVWDYFYIGVGIVSFGLSREDIWSNDQYAKYRDFFNILACYSNGKLKHYEAVYPHHTKKKKGDSTEDWEKRCGARYWVFDPKRSQFNLVDPIHVATYTKTKGPFEIWRSSQDQQVARLETLLFPPLTQRLAQRHGKLRTRNVQPHRHINLVDYLPHADLNALRSDLIELAKPRHSSSS